MGLDHQVVCEFADLERCVEETTVLGWAAKNDLEYEVARHARLLGSKYNIMPKQRGRIRWEIRDPGELLVVIRGERVFEDE